MISEERKQFIAKHKNLFWYTPENKKEEIGDDLLVETILNYGDMEAVLQLFQVMGIKTVSEVFFKNINKSERCKNNYYELTLNYFTILFNRYAS